MRTRRLLFLCFAASLPAAGGCGSGFPAFMDSADVVILYSIDGNFYQEGKKPKTEENFHGFPVLGKVEVTDAEKRQELIRAVKAGIYTYSISAGCFNPRHGVRFVRGEQWVDYVICFECNNVYEYSSSDDKGKEMHPRMSLKDILNKHLTDAGVPLASEEKKGG
jgi:hypothetical protein